ncbi:hypothetical protein TL16_g11128 [Triparma laevis f. inornata]|uniref:Uncharacterized protein n=1 Tax=Triparma laevis f. inornata TaxID=1714386 RepID=A0A9W7BCJ7_9STRA|nr:hypothetical protein TL16_g11128 [Triparma laevis f. inornata]
MDTPTAIWYGLLCLITALNIVFTYKTYKNQKWSTTNTSTYAYQSNLFYLSLPFIFECGYRSVLPRVDIPRLCFFDCWPNMILFGRLSAFIGEWCWMLQISLVLQKVLEELQTINPKSSSCDSVGVAARIAKLIPYMCLLAECFGTTGPVTSNNLWCIFEASTWTTMYILTTFCAYTLRSNLSNLPESNSTVSRFANVLMIAGFIYIPYMVFINIPLYVQRYQEDTANGVTYLTFEQGLPDIAACHSASQVWEDWKDDAGWMVGYFGPAVWSSIWLMNAPTLVPEKEEQEEEKELTRRLYRPVTVL